MSDFDLNQEFIARVALPKTSIAFPHIRYASESEWSAGLYCRAGWFPTTAAAAPKNIYVLFVGTAEAIEKHEPAIADVRARGNDILVFEFSGQGASGRFLPDPRKVHALPDGFDMWTNSLKEFLRSDLFRAVRQRGYDHDAGVIALPYSLGGHMFARLMQEEPAFSRRFTRIVYVNPVVAMNSAGSMAMRLIQQVSAWLSVSKPGKSEDFVPGHGRFHPGDRPLEKSSIGSDRERHEWICRFYRENEHLAMWGMTYGWFHEANRSMTRMWDIIIDGEAKNPFFSFWSKARDKDIPRKNETRVPTLVISSHNDTIVIAHYVQRFAKYIGADTLHLPRAKHEPSQEPPPIRENTFDAVAAWVADPDNPNLPATSDIRLSKNNRTNRANK
ncbi:MAG: alpha/beta hydrolase [Pseudomonadota bacterium]